MRRSDGPGAGRSTIHGKCLEYGFRHAGRPYGRQEMGDGMSAGTVTESATGESESVSTTRAFAVPETTTIQPDVTDGSGDTGSSVFMHVVGHYPHGGFVTDGRWIISRRRIHRAPGLCRIGFLRFCLEVPEGAKVPSGQPGSSAPQPISRSIRRATAGLRSPGRGGGAVERGRTGIDRLRS